MTWGDVAVLAVLFLIAFFVIRSLVKNSKKGCSMGCANCARKGECHFMKPEENNEKRS